MRLRTAIRIVAGTVLTTMAFCALAQENAVHHRRYRIVEIATFGGPNSGYNVGTRIATNDGTVVGGANTSTPDPFAPDCFDLSTCLVQHAWKWQDGALTDLGALPAGYSSWAEALNSRGLVVGYARDGELDPLTGAVRFVATIWNHGQIKNLGTLGGGFSFALGATDQNFVMGLSDNGVIDTSGFPGFDGVSEVRTFGWKGGTMFDLGTLGGTGAFPATMNGLGQVIGVSSTSPIPGPSGSPPVHPFLWTNGKMRDLGTLGGNFAGANAISNQGQVAGQSTIQGDLIAHAFLWERGKMTDLGALGGSVSSANWLNDLGEVIGISLIAGDICCHAFVWKHGVMTDLRTVSGDNSSNAYGINDRGQVVGQSWFFDDQLQQLTASHGFLWEGSGPMVDLNTLIVNPTDLLVTEANFITDRGWIVANGLLPNGDGRAAILIPEDDASELTRDTNLANGGPTLRPLPLTREMLRSLNKQSMQLQRQPRSLTRQWMQLHRYPQLRN
jgi:probable HAF family extracellular repeat protein